MKLQPLEDHVVILPRKPKEMSPGGIVLPDHAQERQAIGRVISVGPGRTREDGTAIKMSVSPGDIVLYGIYAGTDFDLDIEGEKQKVKLMRQTELLSKLVE